MCLRVLRVARRGWLRRLGRLGFEGLGLGLVIGGVGMASGSLRVGGIFCASSRGGRGLLIRGWGEVLSCLVAVVVVVVWEVLEVEGRGGCGKLGYSSFGEALPF